MENSEKPWKMWGNTGTKLVKAEARRNHLVSEPNYNTAKFLSENLLTTELGNRILILKPFYLGL